MPRIGGVANTGARDGTRITRPPFESALGGLRLAALLAGLRFALDR